MRLKTTWLPPSCLMRGRSVGGRRNWVKGRVKSVCRRSCETKCVICMEDCVTCGRNLPSDRFNRESFSPDSCFRCRIEGVSFGYTAGRSSFHGDTLVGGTIASDNRNTMMEARAQGHEPVPLVNGEGSYTPTAGQNDRLKKTLEKQKVSPAL